jgi:predicted dehydrogenase
MRIGIVGSGTISRHHLSAASRYPGCEIVGVADRDLTLARAQAARYGVPRAFDSLGALLELRPDVVHVLTPPATHEALTCEALAAGAHVYVEKPMALSETACASMKAAAQRADRRLCVGQSMLYMAPVTRARELLASGAAGEIVHVAAGFNYDVRRNRTYGRGHWAAQLPGGLAEDLAVHPASLLIHLLGRPTRVLPVSRSHPDIPDGKPAESIAIMESGRGLGVLSVSLTARPDMAVLDISCTRMMLRLNIASMALTAYRQRRVPKAVGRALVNLDVAAQLVAGTVSAGWQLLRGRLDGSWGVVSLIHAFYGSLERGEPPPFGPDEGEAIVSLVRHIWPEPASIPEKAAA